MGPSMFPVFCYPFLNSLSFLLPPPVPDPGIAGLQACITVLSTPQSLWWASSAYVKYNSYFLKRTDWYCFPLDEMKRLWKTTFKHFIKLSWVCRKHLNERSKLASMVTQALLCSVFELWQWEVPFLPVAGEHRGLASKNDRVDPDGLAWPVP